MKPKKVFSNLSVLSVVLFCIFVLSGNALYVQQKPSKRQLTIDDLFKIKGVGNPEISPDGKWVAYTVTCTDLDKDNSETRIWMAPTGGGEPLSMTGKGYSASSPSRSPDGIRRPSFQKDRYERYLTWYGQYVKGESEKNLIDRGQK